MSWFDRLKNSTTLTLNPFGFLSGLARNQQAKSSAQRQMEFQERMANTAHQRQMADLKKAGLNPILGFSSGMGGAPSPSGAMYTPENVGLTTAQATSALGSAKLSDTQAEIEKRTLAMLRKRNVTLPDIQYTAQNIFQSQVLTAIEGGVLGEYDQVSRPYREIAKKVNEYLKDSGAFVKPDSYIDATVLPNNFRYQLDLSGENLFKLYMHVFDETTKMGVASLKEGGGSLMRLLKEELNPFNN